MSRVLLVEAPGFSSTVQDLGRVGWQRFGISGSGAIDADAFRLANALVGNPPEAAAVEMTLTGVTATAVGGPAQVAVAGADMPVRIDGRAFEGWRSFTLPAGGRIEIGAARTGSIAYLAVAGGLALEGALGSLSTHTRSAIGGVEGRALAAGDRLPLAGGVRGGDRMLPAADRPRTAGPVRVVLGPQADRFTDAGIATFLGSAFTVTPRKDRMGAHLDGPAVEHRDGFNIVSDGIVNGSVQVPGTGRPLVLLADRQTTGGYPKIATIVSADIARLAQRRPGETVRFQAVTAEEAVAIARERARALAAAIGRIRPVTLDPADLPAEDLLGLNLVDGVCSALD